MSSPVAGNYYPLASPGVIRIRANHDDVTASDQRGFVLMTDRGHGATSLRSGEVEVMIGRRVAEVGSITVDDTDHVNSYVLCPDCALPGHCSGSFVACMRRALFSRPLNWS